MELLLNAVWVVLATMAATLWLSAWRRRSRSHPLLGLLAVACVFALLFPVISMSDDLRSTQVVMEDASATSKRMLKASDLSKTPLSLKAAAAAAAVRGPEHQFQWQALGSVTVEQPVAIASVSLPLDQGRAPPTAL